MFSIARQIIKKAPKWASYLGIHGHIVKAGTVEIWYESFGLPSNPCILLIMGGGCQGICWGDSFCKNLADNGFFVIRFDSRDTGFSSYCHKKSSYNLMDMTVDVLELLRALKIEQAHLCGISMGGAIAQLMAVYFPSCVKTITLIATTSDFIPIVKAFGEKKTEQSFLSSPETAWLSWLKEVEKIPFYDVRSKLKKHLEGWKILNGPKAFFDAGYYKDLMRRSLLRQRSWRSLLKHKDALISSVDLVKETEGKIFVPALIVAGGYDPLFPRDHADNLALKIAHSSLYRIEEMGHNFNPCFFGAVVQKMTDFIHQ